MGFFFSLLQSNTKAMQPVTCEEAASNHSLWFLLLPKKNKRKKKKLLSNSPSKDYMPKVADSEICKRTRLKPTGLLSPFFWPYLAISFPTASPTEPSARLFLMSLLSPHLQLFHLWGFNLRIWLVVKGHKHGKYGLFSVLTIFVFYASKCKWVDFRFTTYA